MGLRDELHALVEKLTDEQLREAQIALLDVLITDDDEPLTAAESTRSNGPSGRTGATGSRTRRSDADSAGRSGVSGRSSGSRGRSRPGRRSKRRSGPRRADLARGRAVRRDGTGRRPEADGAGRPASITGRGLAGLVPSRARPDWRDPGGRRGGDCRPARRVPLGQHWRSRSGNDTGTRNRGL